MKIGDVNGDGEIGELEALKLAEAIRDGKLESVGQAIRADVNGDRVVDSKDINMLFQNWDSPSEFPANDKPISNAPGMVLNSIPHSGAVYTVNQPSKSQLSDLDPIIRDVFR